MQDFNEYAKNAENFKTTGAGGFDGDLFKTVTETAKKFDGKNGNDILKAIYAEAERGKKNGTLSNADLDNFAAALAPMLDDKKKSLLKKVIAELKKI